MSFSLGSPLPRPLFSTGKISPNVGAGSGLHAASVSRFTSSSLSSSAPSTPAVTGAGLSLPLSFGGPKQGTYSPRSRLVGVLLFVASIYLLMLWLWGSKVARDTTVTTGQGSDSAAMTPSILAAWSQGQAACALCPHCQPSGAKLGVPRGGGNSHAVVRSTTAASHATVERNEVLSSGGDGDSTGELLLIQGRGSLSRNKDEYKLCTFTNVCLQHDLVLFLRREGGTAETKDTLLKEWEATCGGPGITNKGGPGWKQPLICACFHGYFRAAFLTEEQRKVALDMLSSDKPFHQLDPTPVGKKHVWGVQKWVPIHHIAHWAQKLLIFQSLYQHGASIPLPPLDGMVFHDSDQPLTEHERVILNVALESLQPSDTHPLTLAVKDGSLDARMIFAETLRKQKSSLEMSASLSVRDGAPIHTSPSHLTCFGRVSWSPFYGLFSTHADDTTRFRENAYKTFDLPPPQRCPPRRAVLLYRHNRKILNRAAIVDMLKDEFGLELEYRTVDERSSSQQQVSLFASTGLMLSSHSSQLTNMLFSPPGSAIVEISPEFYNADFAEYAHGMGIFFQYALGGVVPDGVSQPSQDECISLLSTCEGASHCIIDRRHACKNKNWPNKNHNFVANVTAIKIAVKNSMQHLNWLCTGRW